MIAFNQYFSYSKYDLERSSMIESFLSEMPYLNKIPKGKEWSQDQIDALWDLCSGERLKQVAKVGSETIVMYEQSGVRYFFVLKDNRPVFVVSFLKRVVINAWQEDIVAKTTSEIDVKRLYSLLNSSLKMFICSSQNHSLGMKKIWSKIIERSNYKTYIQSLRDPEDFTKVNNSDDAYESNKVFVVTKIK